MACEHSTFFLHLPRIHAPKALIQCNLGVSAVPFTMSTVQFRKSMSFPKWWLQYSGLAYDYKMIISKITNRLLFLQFLNLPYWLYDCPTIRQSSERNVFCLSDYYLIILQWQTPFLGDTFIAKSSILLSALKKLTLKYKQMMIIWSPKNASLEIGFLWRVGSFQYPQD